ncbi:MAG: class I SAM-dependent methyltransferase [Kouleothrix sp.]|nr:class I SAM-dependent methyltransferase [Kouleothrix sp.]
MTFETPTDRLGKDLSAGAHHYRAWVGAPDNYDLSSGLQFSLLVALGMREHHTLLDVGCGSLRGGRLSIVYLLPQRYFGIEPEQWLIEAGIANELGQDLIDLKQPSFNNDGNFTLSVFQRSFDFLIAQSIFSHATQAQIRHCLDEAKQVMTPTSLFVANFAEGEQNYEGDEWVYPGCSHYTMDYMIRLVEGQGLRCTPIQWPHPIGLSWVLIYRPDYQGDALDLASQPAFLKAEADRYKKQLDALQSNPYVRLSLVANRLVARLRGRGGAS